MGVTSTVSRLPITVKVVPVSSNDEEGQRELQRQGEGEEEEAQRQNNQTQREEEAAHTGYICLTLLTHPTPPTVNGDYIRALYWSGVQKNHI